MRSHALDALAATSQSGLTTGTLHSLHCENSPRPLHAKVLCEYHPHEFFVWFFIPLSFLQRYSGFPKYPLLVHIVVAKGKIGNFELSISSGVKRMQNVHRIFTAVFRSQTCFPLLMRRGNH